MKGNKTAGEKRALLGQLLLETGYITQGQLAEALVCQEANPERPIGDVLIELGYLSQRRLERGVLALQELERKYKRSVESDVRKRGD